MPTVNKYNGLTLSDNVNPVTGKSDAQVYNDAEKALASARALLAGGSSTPAPAPTTFNYDFGGNEDAVLASLMKQAGQVATDPVDEDKIRRNTLKLFQKEIDATNTIYDDLVNRQQVVNANNLGGLRAIQNRQGLVGSGRANTQTTEQRDLNQQAIGAIQAERGLKIGEIMGQARKEALDEITAKRSAQQQGASAYLAYVEMEDQRKQSSLSRVINAMIQQGVDPSTMSDQELQDIAKNLGMSTTDIIAGFNTANADKLAEDASRATETAIIEQLNAGVVDPKKIYSALGGSVPLDEITRVTKALKGDSDAFNLSQGQARYVLQPDGTYKQVAYNPKTYQSDGSGGGSGIGSGGTAGGALSFEEWLKTPEAQALAEARNAFYTEHQTEPSAQKAVVTNELEQAYQEYLSTNPTSGFVADPLTNLTPTNKRDLQQAGLSGGDPLAQSYFLNTDSAFRDYFSRGIASGQFPREATLDDVDRIYTEWYDAKQNKDGEDLSIEEMLKALEE